MQADLITTLIGAWFAAAAPAAPGDITCATYETRWAAERTTMGDSEKHQFVSVLFAARCVELGKAVHRSIKVFNPAPPPPGPQAPAALSKPGGGKKPPTQAKPQPVPPPADRYAFCDLFDPNGSSNIAYTDVFKVPGTWTPGVDEARFRKVVDQDESVREYAHRCRSFADRDLAKEFALTIEEQESPRARLVRMTLTGGVHSFRPYDFKSSNPKDGRFKGYPPEERRYGYCSTTVHGSNAGDIVTNLVVTEIFRQPPWTGAYVTGEWTNFVLGLRADIWSRGECRIAKSREVLEEILRAETKPVPNVGVVTLPWTPWYGEADVAARAKITKNDFLRVVAK